MPRLAGKESLLACACVAMCLLWSGLLALRVLVLAKMAVVWVLLASLLDLAMESGEASPDIGRCSN